MRYRVSKKWLFGVKWKLLDKLFGEVKDYVSVGNIIQHNYRQGQWWEFFLFAAASRPALGPTQPPIRRVPGALTPAVKRPGREVEHSPPSSAEVKNAWSYTSTPKKRHGVMFN
jgi:hypothetical protein